MQPLLSRNPWRVLICANSWNSWPVISKNRHEFHEFHENDHCALLHRSCPIFDERLTYSAKLAPKLGG